jgi:hypothetical protein
MRNGSDLVGAAVDVNGVEYVTNETGWISFDVSSDDVGRVYWEVSGIKYANWTNSAKSVTDPQIIWDRVIVTDSVMFDTIVQADSSQTVWLTAEYEYDSMRFDDSKGQFFLNDEPMSWSTQSSRWERNVTSSIIGPQMYEATAVDDNVFSLTRVRNQDKPTEITWDKIDITTVELETMTLELTRIKVYTNYSYTKNPVVNATVSVNGNKCNEIETGVYTSEIRDWNPLQSFIVEVEYPSFEQSTKTVVNVHVSNVLLYVAIGLAVALTVTVVVSKRKRNQKTPNTTSCPP